MSRCGPSRALQGYLLTEPHQATTPNIVGTWSRAFRNASTSATVLYAAKLTREEGVVDWAKPASEIARAVRAYNPFPGAQTPWRGENLKLWTAQATDQQGASGTLLAADKTGIVVACGQGALRITELQRAGGKRVTAAQFLAGCELKPGERLA